jgi:hypothetical protein
VMLILLLVAPTADAQRLTSTRSGALAPAPLSDRALTPPSVPTVREASQTRMVATGTMFAVAGLVAGAYVGAEMACAGDDDSWCDLGGGILGATAGEVLMLPLGIHIAGSRTSYGKKLAVSSAVMLGGVALAAVTGGLSLLAVPPMQLMTIVAMENRAGPTP